MGGALRCVLVEKGTQETKSPETHPHVQSTRLSEQFMGRGPSFQQMALGQLVMCKRMKSDPCFTLCRKPNSAWVKGLNVNDENYKTLRRKQVNVHEIGFGKGFLEVTPKVQATREING